MITRLKPHSVKKGEGMVAVMKRNGLDPKDWKTVYTMPYNKPVVARYAKLGHLEPGDEILVPTMARTSFRDIESGLFWVEDRLVDLLDTYGTLKAELFRLTREKAGATKAYEKAKAKLVKLEKRLITAKAECAKSEKKAGQHEGLAPLVNSIVACAPEASLTNELKYLRDNHKTLLEDKKAAEKALKALQDKIARREKLLGKAQDILRSARNHFVKLEWEMYG